MPWMRVTGRRAESVGVGTGRAGAGVTGVTGLFLAEAEDVKHVEVVRAYRILEVVGGLILGLVCPADPNRPGQPPADERP